MARPARLGAYAKLSATYYRDDAILAAGEAAELLFVRCLAFCSETPSDGFISDLQMTRVVGAGLKALPKRLKALTDHGPLVREEGGYLVRSWLNWNKSADEIGMERKRDRERKRDGKATESERIPDGTASDSLSETGQDKDKDIAPKESARRKDELFDALTVACGINPDEITASARGQINGALKQLRDVNATPAQITLRARNFTRRYRDVTITPSALAKHWSALGDSLPQAVGEGIWS